MTTAQISKIYADEADVLNLALFGKTARQWREENTELKGNIRDYANVAQLVCLLNLENLNSVFINENITQSERLQRLNFIAINKMKILANDHRIIALDSSIKEDGDGELRKSR